MPWARAGRWPIWAYLDRRLDSEGLVAADVLVSLPGAGQSLGGRARYELMWYVTSGSRIPAGDTPIALTIAGLWHVGGDSAQLLAAFMDTLRFLVAWHRRIEPDPYEVKTVEVSSEDLAHWMRQSGLFAPIVDELVPRIGQLLQHEPYLLSGFRHPVPDRDPWKLEIRDSIRDFRDVTTIEEYIDRVEQMASPPGAPSQPFTAAPLDIAYAVSFVDAVWESRTRSPLFVRPDPASIARLTQPCDSEGAFNSLMSALADVLSQVAKPGTGRAPRSGALEEVRRYLEGELDPAAATRCSDAIDTLIQLRTVRHSIEHGDARAKAVAAYAGLGIPFPVGSWPDAWARVVALACGSLDVLREEVNAGITRP